MLKQGDGVGIVACFNVLHRSREEDIQAPSFALIWLEVIVLQNKLEIIYNYFSIIYNIFIDII